MSRPRRHTSFHPTSITSQYSDAHLNNGITEAPEVKEDPIVLPSTIPPTSAMSSSRSVRGQRMRNKTVEVAKTYEPRSLSKNSHHINGDLGAHQPVPTQPQHATPQQSRSGHMTYRGVRSLKHKNQRSQDGPRKCNSLTDLRSASNNSSMIESRANIDIDDYGSSSKMYRSRSRERLFESCHRRHHSVGSTQRHPSFGDSSTSPDSLSHPHDAHSSSCFGSPGSTTGAPKTFYESLRDALMTPPPIQLPTSDEGKENRTRYLKYASIPHTNTIQDYEGHEENQQVCTEG